jgi:phosphoglucosamine mutase
MGKYFGLDGIRGKAYSFLTFELAFSLGKSLIILNQNLLVVGKDTRESGDMLIDAVIQGAKISGIDIINLGVVPTPLLSYISQILDCIGVMITASHNPYQDNGIKVFTSGNKIFLDLEEKIEKVMDEDIILPIPSKVGKNLPPVLPFDLYLSLFNDLLIPSNFNIGLDLANGATFKSGKLIFSKIAKNLVVIGDSPNGQNINLNVGSTHPESLVALVKEQHLDFGFAFDGDGDRVLMVNQDGKIYDGDLLIFVIALYLKSKSLLKDNIVVLTKMSNLGIIKSLKNHGIDVVLTDVGDKFVLNQISDHHYTLGGENSGHIINTLLLNSGDGVLNAAFIVKILREWHTTIDELTKTVIIYPSKLVNLQNIDKSLVNHEEVQTEIKKIKNILGDDGDVLVRASGTEPLVRINVIAPTTELVDESISSIINVFEKLKHK